MDAQSGTRMDARVADGASAGRTTAPSILFPEGPGAAVRPPDPPQAPFLHDLRLEQVITAVVRGRSEYDLVPLFRTRLAHPDGVAFRHDVVRDLDQPSVRATIEVFAGHMRRMRRYLSVSQTRATGFERDVWRLYGAAAYVDAVDALAEGLAAADLRAAGLTAFRTWLTRYAESDAIQDLTVRSRQVLDGLADVRYCLHIEDGAVTVTPCVDEEQDYTAEVAQTFARFREDRMTQPGPAEPPDPVGLNGLERAVLERVAQLFPDEFADLQRFSGEHAGFVDEAVHSFDREAQFYLAYLDHITQMRRAGLPFCYPTVSQRAGDVHVERSFDIALAHRLAGHGAGIVLNDVVLAAPQRVLVVTGANQGGKTTYVRMVGQVHHLAALGLPVPGELARLPLVDHLFTHFPVRERLEDLRGRLEDELVRVHDIMERATTDSLMILNELFGATKMRDATVLGAAILDRAEKLGLLCAFVTFTDELAVASPTRVSLVAEVDPEDPSVRTFKVTPKPPEGRAHAFAIAEKHGLTYERLRSQISR